MDLTFTAEEEVLRADARAALAAALPGDDASTSEWATVSGLAERAWLGGRTVLELTIVAAELGRAAAPLVAHNVILADLLLCEIARREPSASADAALADVRSGLPCAVAYVEPDDSYRPEHVATVARPVRDGWRLDGAKAFVPDGASVERLFVVARTDPAAAPSGPDGPPLLTVFAITPRDHGVACTSLDSIGGDRQAYIELSDVLVSDRARIGAVGAAGPCLQRAMSLAIVAQCADMVGAAEAALAATVERVLTRHQWGAPIAALQAVQHRCADMDLDVTIARDTVLDAASSIDRGDDESLAASSAKATCFELCRRVTASAHQLHGGQGIYADQPVHRWYRRVKAVEPVYGSPRSHRAEVAARVLGR